MTITSLNNTGGIVGGYYPYAFTDFTFTLISDNKSHMLAGFSDSKSAVTWKWNTPQNVALIGLNGKMAIAPTVDNSGIITLEFMWQSPSVEILSNIVKLQQSSIDGLPPRLVLSIQNIRDTGWQLKCDYCIITTRAEGSLGKGFTTKTFEFHASNMVETPGVNPYSNLDATQDSFIPDTQNTNNNVFETL